MSKQHYLDKAAAAVNNYPRLSEDDKRALTAEVQTIVSDAYDNVPFSENGAATETPAEPSTEAPVEEPAAETPVTETPATEPPVVETPATDTPIVVGDPATPVEETPATETPAEEHPSPTAESAETPTAEEGTPAPVEEGAGTDGTPTTVDAPVTLEMIWSKLVSLEARVQKVEEFQQL